MSIKGGARKLAPYQGNFGQSKASGFARFAGVLNDDEFRRMSDGMARAMKAETGKAGMSRSLMGALSGKSGVAGMSDQMKQEMEDQKILIAQQQDQINELGDAIGAMTPAPAPDTSPDIDETNIT